MPYDYVGGSLVKSPCSLSLWFSIEAKLFKLKPEEANHTNAVMVAEVGFYMESERVNSCLPLARLNSHEKFRHDANVEHQRQVLVHLWYISGLFVGK